MKRTATSRASECEYFIEDDRCVAVKKAEIKMLRADSCPNAIKDACCYSCDLQGNCEISCNLLNGRSTGRVLRNLVPSRKVQASGHGVDIKCGNCIHYMKPKCPRQYVHDTELWRKQDPCEIFEAAQESGP